uniref:Uncharacterized protein n=1 Tax=Salmonella phage vB_STmST313_KE28 TaxID=3161179 RepID=A0AAU8GH70_9CAUD
MNILALTMIVSSEKEIPLYLGGLSSRLDQSQLDGFTRAGVRQGHNVLCVHRLHFPLMFIPVAIIVINQIAFVRAANVGDVIHALLSKTAMVNLCFLQEEVLESFHTTSLDRFNANIFGNVRS